MSLCKNSISCEITKIHRSRVSWKIENFYAKLNSVHIESFSIPGVATWWVIYLFTNSKIILSLFSINNVWNNVCRRIETHPNHIPKDASRGCGRRFTKLVFHCDCPENRNKKRLIRIEVKTKVDICIWIEDFFEFEGRVEKVREEFINQVFLNSYLIDNALALEGLIIVKEFDCFPEIASSILTRQDKILHDIGSLHLDENLSDFKFTVDGAEFPIHKNILAARSPVFCKMFTGDFTEKNGSEREILDVSKEVFAELIRFMYTGEIEDLEGNVNELLCIADRYEVLDLQKMCELKLMSKLNDDNAEDVFQLAHSHNCNNEMKKVSFQMLQV